MFCRHVSNCCCGCCTLEKGATFISILGIVEGFSVQFAAILVWGPNSSFGNLDFLAFLIPISLGQIGANTLLYSGVRKRRLRFLLPWMILNQVKILCLMVGVVLVIASGIDSVEDGNSIGLVVETAGDRARHAWIFTAVAGSIFIGLQIYFYDVVFSLYEKFSDVGGRNDVEAV